MAGINDIKKHYDRLTDRERFALLVAAAGRDDDAEIKELQQTAQRKHVSYPSTIGLSEGFRFAGTWYMMQQQADLMTVHWMFYTFDDDPPRAFDWDFEGRQVHAYPEEIVGELIRRVLARHAAWQDLCQDYKIDPAAMLEIYPRFDVMQMMIGILTVAAQEKGPEAQPSQAHINNALEDMRGQIERLVADWA
jgi:hypothetical protein